MSFEKKFGLFEKKSITKTIRGVDFEFYPVCVKNVATGKLADLMIPLTAAITTLVQPNRNDMKQTQDVSPDGSVITQAEAISREMAMYRDTEKAKAIKEAWGMLLNDETRLLVGAMLMDSLRDDCPRNPSGEQVSLFIDNENMDLPTVVEFIKGFLEANASIFGETGKELAGMVKAKVKEATELALVPGPELEVADAPAPEMTDTPSEEGAL